MSYILDALKKAEAERRGGQHASGPIPPSFHVHARRQPVWQRPWLWAVLSAAAVVAGGLIWMGGAPSSAPQPPAQETQAAQAPATAATPSPAVPAVPAAPVVPAVPAAPSAPPVAQAPASPAPAAPAPSSAPPGASAPPLAQAPARAPEQPVEKPRPAERKPAEKKAPEAARATKKPQEEAVAAAPAAPAPVPAEKPKPAPEPQVGTLRDLPPQIQQEVPQYSVGGYIYSGNKADRSVVINKRLLREGDEIAPGLTLERMTPTGMVLNYKGYRYRASY